MSIEQPGPSSETAASGASSSAPLPPAAQAGGRRGLIALALAAGALSGLGAWIAWEAVGGYFAPRGESVTILGSEQTIVTVEGRVRAGIRGGAAGAGLLGAALGLGLG